MDSPVGIYYSWNKVQKWLRKESIVDAAAPNLPDT